MSQAKTTAQEVEALRQLWESEIALDVYDGILNFAWIHRNYGFDVCADAIRSTARKLSREPGMTVVQICRYCCGTARNISTIANGGVVANYKPQMETR